MQSLDPVDVNSCSGPASFPVARQAEKKRTYCILSTKKDVDVQGMRLSACPLVKPFVTLMTYNTYFAFARLYFLASIQGILERKNVSIHKDILQASTSTSFEYKYILFFNLKAFWK
jgi:hypothetical protein